MSTSKKVSKEATFPTDVGVGTIESGGLLARLRGQRADLNELGKEYFLQSLQYDPAKLKRDSITVRRKLDFIVLPMVQDQVLP